MTASPLTSALTHGTKFELGRIVTTPGVLKVTTQEQRTACLTRHAGGDWGHISDEDEAVNNDALRDGDRIISAYPIDPALPCEGLGNQRTLWIITEADRSVTTLLLPHEY